MWNFCVRSGNISPLGKLWIQKQEPEFLFSGKCYFVGTTMKTANQVRNSVTGRYPSDHERWNAVVRRDANADGIFYYSVKTTGVYCRPSCAARRARREHVRFHATCAEAEGAGFRACQRCQPNGPALAEQHATKVAAACRSIETAETPPSLAALAKTAGLSRFHFHRVFTKLAGLTPKAYAMAHRAKRIRQALPKPGTITEAIYAAGYNSNGRFYAESSRLLGMTPKRFRQGGKGEAIRFALSPCSLGSILVAASEKGVCAIALGDDPDRLSRDLRDRFPRAQLTDSDPQFHQLVTQVVAYVEAPKLGFNLPLDVRGTAFRQRVWSALCKIPAGTTASYSEVAAAIGAPQSVRAVASACAANTIAVAIPCHRVLRTDGSLSGYRWGVERKRRLLQREAK